MLILCRISSTTSLPPIMISNDIISPENNNTNNINININTIINIIDVDPTPADKINNINLHDNNNIDKSDTNNTNNNNKNNETIHNNNLDSVSSTNNTTKRILVHFFLFFKITLLLIHSFQIVDDSDMNRMILSTMIKRIKVNNNEYYLNRY